jgi:uridine phosphorylase
MILSILKEFSISFDFIIDMSKSQKPPHWCLATGDYRLFKLFLKFLDELHSVKSHIAYEYGLVFCRVGRAFILYTSLHALTSVVLLHGSPHRCKCISIRRDSLRKGSSRRGLSQYRVITCTPRLFHASKGMKQLKEWANLLIEHV